MIFISHRGNLKGPNKEEENNPSYITTAINKGFHVEADVFFINDNFFLGHDKPLYQIKANFLENENQDELYDKALEIVKSEGKASTSFLQRKLQIGYNRAARIIDMMEEEGIVSKANHVGKREIF